MVECRDGAFRGKNSACIPYSGWGLALWNSSIAVLPMGAGVEDYTVADDGLTWFLSDFYSYFVPVHYTKAELQLNGDTIAKIWKPYVVHYPPSNSMDLATDLKVGGIFIGNPRGCFNRPFPLDPGDVLRVINYSQAVGISTAYYGLTFYKRLS